MSLPQRTDVNVQEQLAFGQRVVVLDNTDPDDPYTGATGTIQRSSQWRSGLVYEVWLDALVRGRHITNFRADELEAVA